MRHSVIDDAFFRTQLNSVSSAVREFLKPHLSLRSFAADNVIYFQDDPTDQIYFVNSGYVRLCYITEDGTVALQSIVPPGLSFGEAGALDRSGYLETAFTATRTQVLLLGLGWLDSVSEEAKELRSVLGNLLLRRHRDHVEVTRGLYKPLLVQRLAHSLLYLIDVVGKDVRYSGKMCRCLGPVVTQRELGTMVRGTRENVNKALRKWQMDGILAIEDRHIIALDEARLRELSMSHG